VLFHLFSTHVVKYGVFKKKKRLFSFFSSDFVLEVVSFREAVDDID
jgi:hypothetical protein